MTQLTRSNIAQEKRFYKTEGFSDFSSFSGTLVRLSIKIDDFGIYFHKIFLSVNAVRPLKHHKYHGYMENLYLKELFFLSVATILYFTKITNAVEPEEAREVSVPN